MIHNQQYSLPLVLETANENLLTVSTYRNNQDEINEMKQRNLNLNHSKSYYRQELTTNESEEEEFILNYSDIQQSILKEKNESSKICSEEKRNVINVEENNRNQMSKHYNHSFYSRARVIKHSTRQENDNSFLSHTPTKQTNQTQLNHTANKDMRKTTTSIHISEYNKSPMDRIQSHRNVFGVTYSLNKIKSSMKQQKEPEKSRSFTIQDSIMIEGKKSMREKSFDQSTNSSFINPSNFEKELEKRKRVIYSRKSTTFSKSSLAERQTISDLSNSNNNNTSAKIPFLNTAQQQNPLLNQTPSFHSSQRTGTETYYSKNNSMSPSNKQQGFRPFKLVMSPLRRKNIKQKQNLDYDLLSSNYQQNYLALFPINSPKIQTQISDIKGDRNKQESSQDPSEQMISKLSTYYRIPPKKNQKFEFVHMNDLNSNMEIQQVPQFSKNIVLPRNSNLKFHASEKLKPIKIYGDY